MIRERGLWFPDAQSFDPLPHRKHHKFEHISAAQYLVKHFEHHDVVPVASIGSADTGFQESFHRSLSPWQYTNSFVFGFNFVGYVASVLDEWAHNYCPTASHSGYLSMKPIHAEHHFNHAAPFGNTYDEAVREDGFKLDEDLWSHFGRFMPGVALPALPQGPEALLKNWASDELGEA